MLWSAWSRLRLPIGKAQADPLLAAELLDQRRSSGHPGRTALARSRPRCCPILHERVDLEWIPLRQGRWLEHDIGIRNRQIRIAGDQDLASQGVVEFIGFSDLGVGIRHDPELLVAGVPGRIPVHAQDLGLAWTQVRNHLIRAHGSPALAGIPQVEPGHARSRRGLGQRCTGPYRSG